MVYPVPVILILCCQLASAEIYAGFNSKHVWEKHNLKQTDLYVFRFCFLSTFKY